MDIAECINAVYTNVQKLGVTIDIDSIVGILANIMEFVDKYVYLTGEQKKVVALIVLEKIINSSDLSDEDKEKLNNIPYGQMIEVIIAVSRSKYAINKISRFKTKLLNMVTCCKK